MSKKIAILFESKEQLEKYSMYSKRKLINKIGMDFPYITIKQHKHQVHHLCLFQKVFINC